MLAMMSSWASGAAEAASSTLGSAEDVELLSEVVSKLMFRAADVSVEAKVSNELELLEMLRESNRLEELEARESVTLVELLEMLRESSNEEEEDSTLGELAVLANDAVELVEVESSVLDSSTLVSTLASALPSPAIFFVALGLMPHVHEGALPCLLRLPLEPFCANLTAEAAASTPLALATVVFTVAVVEVLTALALAVVMLASAAVALASASAFNSASRVAL